jgi:hypothetical protein
MLIDTELVSSSKTSTARQGCPTIKMSPVFISPKFFAATIGTKQVKAPVSAVVKSMQSGGSNHKEQIIVTFSEYVSLVKG